MLQFSEKIKQLGRLSAITPSTITQDRMAKMERELSSVQKKYKSIEQSYGQDVLNLVLARGFLIRMLGNSAIVRFLKQR